jgi:hypothetical protein
MVASHRRHAPQIKFTKCLTCDPILVDSPLSTGLGEDILLEETVGFTEMCSFFVEGVNVSSKYAKPISELQGSGRIIHHLSSLSIAINTKHKSSHIYFRQRMQSIPTGSALSRPDAVYSDRMQFIPTGCRSTSEAFRQVYI